MEKLAIVLIAAHAIADFFLQSDELVKRAQTIDRLSHRFLRLDMCLDMWDIHSDRKHIRRDTCRTN